MEIVKGILVQQPVSVVLDILHADDGLLVLVLTDYLDVLVVVVGR